LRGVASADINWIRPAGRQALFRGTPGTFPTLAIFVLVYKKVSYAVGRSYGILIVEMGEVYFFDHFVKSFIKSCNLAKEKDVLDCPPSHSMRHRCDASGDFTAAH